MSGMFRMAVAGVALLLAVGGVARGQDVDQLLARGMELHRAGDLLGAVQNYLIALETDPNRADVRSNLGAAYVALGRVTEGVDEYRKALAVRDEPAIRLNLGLALYKSGRIPDAIPEFEAVLKADAANKAAALLLADSLLQMGRHQKVLDLLTPRESDFEGDLGYAYVLGTALLAVGDTDRGQVLIDRIFSKGDSAEARLLMGMAQYVKRDYPAALAELNRALELNPDLPTLQVLYGRVQLNMGDREAATRAFRRELQHNPNSFEANLQLGTLYRMDQRFDDAMLYLRRAEALQPLDPAVRHNLAATHLGQGDAEKARELLEGVVKDIPSYIDAHVLLATTYYRLKRKEDGDRERQIVEKLTAEAQAKQPGAQGGDAPAAPPTAGEPPAGTPAAAPAPTGAPPSSGSSRN